MNKQFRIILFSAVLAINIIGGLLKNQSVIYFSKPLLMILLAEYFFSETSSVKSPLKKWIFIALFFSWTGDVLLMFNDNNSLFFLLGLSSFLIAHVFYIVFFHRVRVQEKTATKIWPVILVVAYYIALIGFLSPYLEDMKLPVRIYGIVISFMFMLALHMIYIKNKMAGRWSLLGASLFVISDSVLAIDKFYQPLEWAGSVIMLTYGLAQLFIAVGAIQYIRKTEPQAVSSSLQQRKQ